MSTEIYCCEKFKRLIEDFEDSQILIHKGGEVVEVDWTECYDKGETNMHYYDFLFCPYCKTDLIYLRAFNRTVNHI